MRLGSAYVGSCYRAAAVARFSVGATPASRPQQEREQRVSRRLPSRVGGDSGHAQLARYAFGSRLIACRDGHPRTGFAQRAGECVAEAAVTAR
jgi:hypothetical protein